MIHITIINGCWHLLLLICLLRCVLIVVLWINNLLTVFLKTHKYLPISWSFQIIEAVFARYRTQMVKVGIYTDIIVSFHYPNRRISTTYWVLLPHYNPTYSKNKEYILLVDKIAHNIRNRLSGMIYVNY